jgi:excisionase family DNA binding protein
MAAKQKGQTNIPAPAADSLSRGALNIAESATYCGVRCSAIESVIRDGKLRGRRLGRNVIILKSDLDAFLASLDIIPAHTPPSILARRVARAVNATPAPAPKKREEL